MFSTQRPAISSCGFALRAPKHSESQMILFTLPRFLKLLPLFQRVPPHSDSLSTLALAPLRLTIRVRDDYDDLSVRAVMMIEITGKSTTEVIRKLRGIVEIRTLHTTNGNWDLVADIHAASLSEFDRVLRQVRMIEGVLNSETSLLLSTV